MYIKNIMYSAIIILFFSFGTSFAVELDSGFLENYTVLKVDPDVKGAMRYVKEGIDLKKYTKIALAPIEIWYDPKTEYKGISPDDMKLLTDSFRDLIVKELEPDYPVVNTAGPDVLLVNLAITNVKMKKKKRSLLNFTPVGFALYTLKDAAGANIILDDAVIEGSLYDSMTGDRLGLLIDKQKATAKKGKASWETLEKSLTFYAQRFRKRMDAEHGK